MCVCVIDYKRPSVCECACDCVAFASGCKRISLNLLPPAATDCRQCAQCSPPLSSSWHSSGVVGFVCRLKRQKWNPSGVTKECVDKKSALLSWECARGCVGLKPQKEPRIIRPVIYHLVLCVCVCVRAGLALHSFDQRMSECYHFPALDPFSHRGKKKKVDWEKIEWRDAGEN